MHFKFSGRLSFRIWSLLTLLWAGLSVAIRRIVRGPLLPKWDLIFEASTRYQKAVYRGVYRQKDIRDGRELLDALVLLAPSLEKVRVESVVTPVKGEWYRPESPLDDGAILYCHGAYAFYAEAEKGLISDLAVATGLPVFALDYRLTPENPFPAQLEDALQAYDWLLGLGYQASDIVVLGTSAGGNLCLSLMLEIRDSGRPHPKLGICLSPWTDIANSGKSIEANERFDILDRSMLKTGAKWFIGEKDPRNPRISPLYADLEGMSPIYIQAGGREIFIDSIRAFYDKALAQGVETSLDVWEAMNHVFQAYGDRLPEAMEAMERIEAVVQSPGLAEKLSDPSPERNVTT